MPFQNKSYESYNLLNYGWFATCRLSSERIGSKMKKQNQKDVCNCKPENLTEIIEAMFKMGQKICDEGNVPDKSIVREEENNYSLEKIFEQIGLKYNMPAAQVKKYVQTTMDQMTTTGENAELKTLVLCSLFGGSPTLEEFILLMQSMVKREVTAG